MEYSMPIVLNAGQQHIADEFFKFLFSPDKEMIIDAGGGYGKTTVISHIIDTVLSQYYHICEVTGTKAIYNSVVITAPTNKATEVLAQQTKRPTQTIYSYLNLKVQDNYKTGESTVVKTKGHSMKTNTIIFIDEYSGIDSVLLKHILDSTFDCKIIYVGDQDQLLNVKSSSIPVIRPHVPMYTLTEPMRNKGHIPLMDLCAHLKACVRSQTPVSIKLHKGVIDKLTDAEMGATIQSYFQHANHDHRVLAYTNNRVIEYTDHIRSLRNLPPHFVKGEMVVNNSAITLSDSMISVEEELEILEIDQQSSVIQVDPEYNPQLTLEVRYADLKSSYGEYRNIPIPQNMDHFKSLIKYAQQIKNWPLYFKLKNNYPDLRSQDAMTVHKSQGSTYDTVFIDLADLSTCRSLDVALRMLYVGVSRAKNRVVFYGELAPKLGIVYE